MAVGVDEGVFVQLSDDAEELGPFPSDFRERDAVVWGDGQWEQGAIG